MYPNHKPEPCRASRGMPSKPLWEASVKQAAKPTSSKRHIKRCLENGIQYENSGGGQWHTIVQVQVKVPDGLGREKWTMEFRQ